MLYTAVHSLTVLLDLPEGALVVSVMGHLRLNWEFLGEPVLAVFSCLAGSLLLTMALTSYIGVAYVTYVFFRIIYQMLITICT